jgi:hypothetical protein
MKRILIMVTTSLLIMLVSSCTKNDYVPDTSTTTSRQTLTLNLTTYHWVPEAEGIFVNTFSNIIPAGYTNPIVKVYLVQNGNEEQISPFATNNASLWATNTQTDVQIHYRDSYHNFWYLNIKVVIQ